MFVLVCFFVGGGEVAKSNGITVVYVETMLSHVKSKPNLLTNFLSTSLYIFCSQFFQAWLNEKFAPELLESKVELVECMLDQIKEMVNDYISSRSHNKLVHKGENTVYTSYYRPQQSIMTFKGLTVQYSWTKSNI